MAGLEVEKGVEDLIRGVNRHIIEVTDTGNAYYERALLVIKPEYASAERDLLEREARKVLRSMGVPSSIKKHSRALYWALRLGAAALIGAAVTAAIFLL